MTMRAQKVPPSAGASNPETEIIGHDVLGPIFYRFCYKLYLSQHQQRQDTTMFLFLSRGGLRIRAFYEAFLKANGLNDAPPFADFYVSRMALIKSNLHDHYDEVAEELLAEYNGFTIDDAFNAFFQPEQYQQWRSCRHDFDIEAKVGRQMLDRAILADSEDACLARTFLARERDNYLKYLSETTGERTNLFVIDTGWSGSIPRYMQLMNPERSVTALFVGRYNYGKPEPAWFSRIVGLEAQAQDFSPRFPITSIFLNRHLVEGVCEVRWPSVTGYRVAPYGKVTAFEGPAPEERILPDASEHHAAGILRHISSAKAGMHLGMINDQADHAAKTLKKKLMYPRKRDLPLFSVAPRSADFGKEISVSFFKEPVKAPWHLRAKIRQSRDSLWQTGQLALEFGLLRHVVQFAYHHRRTVFAVRQRLVGLLRL